jgi:serine/threonine-protein kinase
MALEPAKLSDFKLAAALGAGTTARVYEAVHSASGRPVAIKLMEQSGSSGEMRERFAREALLLAGVDSRYVGKILGFGFERGQPFLVLERLTGETLDAKLRRDGPVPLHLALPWIEQLIAGVRDCHDANVIHRDIKPSNIFLHREAGGRGWGQPWTASAPADEETLKLIDFGVARLREIAGDTTGLTGANHLIGSMGYMAPEQFKRAKSVGFPADLYAIGVVVFRTLTGRLPFVSRSLEAVVRMKSELPVPHISSMPGMPHNPLLDWFVQRAMMREPEGRFRSAREMLDQWRNVIASLAPGQEPAVAIRTAPPVDVPAVRPESSPPPTAKAAPDDEEEHTLRRPGPLAVPGGGRPGASESPASTTQTSYQAISTVPRTTEDDAWETSPPGSAGARPGAFFPRYEHDDTAAMTREGLWGDAPPAAPGSTAPPAAVDVEEPVDSVEDPFEHPTRSDPSLRGLVEQELELWKERNRGS